MQKQFTFTRTDNLTEYQELIYNLFEAWGHMRFQMLTALFLCLFTEEELRNPTYVTAKLASMVQQGPAAMQADRVTNQPISTVETNRFEPGSEQVEAQDEEKTDYLSIFDSDMDKAGI
jgi:hypothetical protein